MTEANLNELQPELDLGEEREALALRMAEIDRQLAERKAAERKMVLLNLIENIKAYNITAAELGLAAAPKVKAEKTKISGAKVAARYRDPVSGAEWTGRGKTPGWLTARIEAGGSKDNFLISRAAPNGGQPAGENSLPDNCQGPDQTAAPVM